MYETEEEVQLIEVNVNVPEFPLCRCCRKKGDADSFYSIQIEGMKELFYQMTGIEIKEGEDEDLMPKHICKMCTIKLIDFYEFRATCIESNDYYQRLVEERVGGSESDIESIETKSARVESPVEFPIKIERESKPKKTKNQVPYLDKLICNECGKAVNRRMFLWHWRYEHKIDENPSICSECLKVFSSGYKLEAHQRTKHGILRCFKCDKRGTVYSTDRKEIRRFLDHVKYCDKDPEQDPFECQFCHTRFTTHQQLLLHESNCSGPTAMCHVCSKEVNKYFLKQHLERHSSEGFPCRTCGKAFPSKISRTIHEKNTCTVEKVICDYCGRISQNKTKLLGHIKRSHIGQKKATKDQCTICGVIVRFLPVHMLTHSDERRYECEFPGCEMTFKSKNILKKHSYSHSKTRPYNCMLCDTGYYQTEYLRGHYKRVHRLIYEKGQKIPYNKR